MKRMANHLRDCGVNFESMGLPDVDARGFYEYVRERILQATDFLFEDIK